MVNLGDLICYRSNDEGKTYGEVVGKKRTSTGDRTYDVYPLRPCPDEYWRYDEDYESVDARDVHFRVQNPKSYEVAWARMGFVMMGTADDGWRFLHQEDAHVHRASAVSDSDDSDETDSDTETEPDSESLGSLEAFLVFTSEDEAEDVDESTHPYAQDANAAFENWIPRSLGERRFKNTIERLEARIKHRARERKNE